MAELSLQPNAGKGTKSDHSEECFLNIRSLVLELVSGRREGR